MRRTVFLILALAVASACATAASPAPAPAPPQIVKKVLDNGLTLLVKQEKGSGLVAITVLVKAGSGQETIQTAGIGNFITQLLLASNTQSSADEVAAVANEVGGNIGAQWHPDYTEIRAVTTSTMFNRAMRLIGECLTEANFEPQWVDSIRADLLRRMKSDNEDLFLSAYAKTRSLLYEDNGYRWPDYGFERTVKLATPDDMKKFHSAYFVPNNTVIAVVGDVTVEQALDRAEKAYAGIGPSKLPPDRGAPDEQLDRIKFQASETNAPAACLMLGWLAPQVTSADFPTAMVAANALGGGKGSLMFRELRQKRGMGYDLGVLYPRMRYQSHIVAYVITDPYKTSGPTTSPTLVLNDVKAALLEQVEILRSQPLSDKDLQRAKGYTIGTYALGQQHLLDRALQLASAEAIGPGYESYWKLADQIDKVTAADVQRFAQRYLGNYAAVLLMPKVASPEIEETPGK